MAKFVRALQLPADKQRRSLPKQTGINLMAAMGAVQQLIQPAAPRPPEQTSLSGQFCVRSLSACIHCASAPPFAMTQSPQQWWTPTL